VNIIGIVSKQKRIGNQGSYYQLTTEAGVELAITMTESVNSGDDAKVLEPLIGKKIEAVGIIRKGVSQLMAFSVKML
jgi:hypothetical protein